MIWMLWSLPAFAALPEAVSACLDRIDTACADRALVSAGKEPAWLAALGETRFYQGRYPEAFDAMKQAVDAGYEDRFDELALFERTMFATANWVEEQRDRFAVRFRPGVDAMLIEDAFAAMMGSDKHIAPLLGGSPPGVSRTELYPDGRSFIAASSLKAEDVETTGVVGLAKWSRLLVTSPRALPRGYPWQDTIAHEYIHLVVTHHTADKAPVWMQEAIAKYLDARWRDGQDRFRLSVRQQGLLAEALRKDDLVSFDEMHPSLAKLPTAERAGLAYAQLATLMQFSFQEGGPQVLVRTLPLVRDGMDAREALATGVGMSDFAELEGKWRAWIAAQPLVSKALAELPTVLDGGDELDLDPVLANRQDLARFVTLGDILKKAGETEASLVEYAKAVPEDEPPSPLLSNRIAQANLELGRIDDAQTALEQTLLDYPEFALSQKTYGQIQLRKNKLPAARDAFLEAVAIHPFDPELHQSLVLVYKALSDPTGVARHERALKVRAQGGDNVERAAIHTREGLYELPTYADGAAPKRADRDGYREQWVGEKVPPISVVGLDGKTIRISEAFAGKVVLLDFWATWCGPCREAMPELAKLHQTHQKAGLEVVGLTSEEAGRVRAFLAKTPMPYTIAIDTGGRANKLFQVPALPTAVVVDRSGRIREVVVGAGPQGLEALKNAVVSALEE